MRYLGFAFALLLAFSAAPASAVTFNVLHTFCTSSGCADGQRPDGPLLMDSSGVLYGTTSLGGSNGAGGASGHGVVFSLTPSGSSYTFQVLYTFCANFSSSICQDGDSPVSGLVIDSSGNLYGTTQFGGANNGGLVFELTKGATTPWAMTPIYSFCATVTSSVCTDGAYPQSKLTYAGAESGTPYSGSGPMFGTTFAGGTSSNIGTVYGVRFSGGAWQQKTILSFTNAIGSQPQTGLVMDATTNVLWGTTAGGGSFDAGVAYSLTPGAHLWSSPWTQTILYNFCWAGSNPCTDGRAPTGIVRDASGNLYGAAGSGGVGTSPGNGIVFALNNGNCTENMVSGFWCNTALYDFCSSGSCGKTPGPYSDMVMDGSGNLYGTTTAGGHATTSNSGVVYELSGSTQTVLHKFCSQTVNCADGEYPQSGVILDSSGNLYGTAAWGGTSSTSGSGVVYQITP